MPTDPVIDFAPLDSEGLMAHLPSYARKWSTLTNVVFKEGKLRPRPGFREAWDWRDFDLPAVARGIPLAILEIHNPGDSNENRQGVDFAAETLTPNASTAVVAGWTGTFADIDETAPDAGATKLATSTTGAQLQVDFTATSNSPEMIPGVVVICRARAGAPGQKALLTFYWRIGGINYQVHQQEVSARESNEIDDWDVFAFEITSLPSTGDPLVKADIDAMNIVVEYTAGSSLVYELVQPAGNGFHTAWNDAVDATTGVFSDYDGEFPWEGDEPVNNGIKPPSTSSTHKHSWTFDDIDATFSSVSSIEFTAWFQGVFGSGTYRIFYRTGGADFTVGDLTVVGSPARNYAIAQLSSITNPNTSAAWTSAQLTGGEFGIQYLTGPPMTLRSIVAMITGLNSGASVEVDWMSAHVMEASSDLAEGGVLGKTRLWSTTKAHLRGNDFYTPDIDDVTNSVALTLPAFVPVDWAQLYGQAYLVNGDDPTRRYPNSTDVYEALTTNNAGGATAITGRTVASFANRIIYGWVKDNTSFIPERIAYSKLFDGGTHDHASAGDFDLLTGSGGVLKLKPLSDDTLVAYKEQGIYNIRQTGLDIPPLAQDLVDAFTSLLAPRTVVSTLTPAGTPIQLFLGTNPTHGLNVYAYDGGRVTSIGDGIQKFLREDANAGAYQTAFAEADPDSGLYYLFIPEGDNQFAEAGFIYHIRTGAWTRFELPFKAVCAGIWSVPATRPDAASGVFVTTPYEPALDAPKRVIVGLLGGRLVAIDHTIAYDAQWPASWNTPTPGDFSSDSSGRQGENRNSFTCTVETGDPRPVQHPGQQVSQYAVHMLMNNHAPIQITSQASADGGKNYSTAVETDAGSFGDLDAYTHQKVDVNEKMAWRPRVKLQFDPVDAELNINPMWELAEMWIQVQPQGDVP